MDNHSPTAGDSGGPAILARDLTRHFDDVVAVNRASFEVGHGEVFGLLGHNGAGKTTTIRLLNGILAPTLGTSRVLGLDPVSDGPALRRRTGVLTATPALDGPLTVHENLEVYAAVADVPAGTIHDRIADLLDVLDVSDLWATPVAELSTGLRQRVALARALVHDPEVVYLDEPTSALDPVAAHGVRDLIASLSAERGRTFIVCTHNLTEAQQLCDRVAILEYGSIASLGTPDDLASQLATDFHVEVRTAVPIAAAVQSAIVALDRVHDITVDHDTVNVSCATPDVIPDLVNTLVAHDVRIYEVTERRPTLEEVYVQLHDQRKAGQRTGVR